MKKSILAILIVATIFSSCKKDSISESDNLYKRKLEKSANIKEIPSNLLPKNLGENLLKFDSYQEMYEKLNFSISGEKILETLPSSVSKTTPSTMSFNNPTSTIVDYSGQISDIVSSPVFQTIQKYNFVLKFHVINLPEI